MLAAYFVPEQKQSPDAAELRQFLRKQLPDYMVPAFYVPLATLPLTSNGKVNRAALPALEPGKAAVDKKPTAPRDPLEEQLTKIWESVLGVQPIGVHHQF